MNHDSFKHIDPDGFHGKELSLHDCVANKISAENNTLCFYFPDGFWVTPHHEENPSDKVVRTDPAAVFFSPEDMEEITLRVFTKSFGLFGKTSVESWNVDKLISAVNSGKCQIEFITQYRSHYEQLWHCAIHSDRKPYYRECQLHFPNTEASFCWNALRLDCEW